MYKLYSFILLAATAVYGGFNADAKTFTISVDNPSQVVVRDPGNNYTPLTWTDGQASVTVDADAYLPVDLSDSRSYVLTSISCDGVNVANASYPTSSATISAALVTDGGTVAITTAEKEAKIFTFLGDPDQATVSLDGSAQEYADGAWTLKPGDYSSISVYAKEGYLLRGVTDGNGNTITPSYGYVSIYSSTYQSNQTFTINTVDAAEARTASFTVVVDGNPSDLKLTRTSDNAQLSVTEASTLIAYDPSGETTYRLEHNSYGKSLASVTATGATVQQQGTSYSVTVTDGAVINVSTSFPDVDVPVTFTFTNPGTEGIVRNVRVDNIVVSGWDQEGFTVKLGSQLSIENNYSDYENVTATLNGANISAYSYTTTVTEETPLEFVYTGTKIQPYIVTIETDCPEGFVVYQGYGSSYPTYTLEFDADNIATIEVPRSNSYITFGAATDYMITAIESGSSTYSAGNGIYVSGDMEFFVSAEQIVRDNTLTLYVADQTWQYRSFTMAATNYSLRQSYTDSQLRAGAYTRFSFGSFDLPFEFSGYPALYLYHNGERVVASGYSSPSISSAQSGDVVKMFSSEPETYGITYDIDSSVDVEVRHDQTLVIETPDTHTVIGPTEVHIVPAPTREAAAALVVKHNGEPVNLIDGKYTINVEADANISVEPATTSGIDTVGAEAATTGIYYNLQGIAVGSDSTKLPAGVYIIDGKKVRL